MFATRKTRLSSQIKPPGAPAGVSFLDSLSLNVADMQQGMNEWRNIPITVRECFCQILEALNAQSVLITNLQNGSRQGAWLDSLKEELEKKADLHDVKQTLDHVCESMNDKVNRSEIGDLFDNVVRKDTFEQELSRKADVQKLASFIEDKVNVSEFRKEVDDLDRKYDQVQRELRAFDSKIALRGETDKMRMRLAELSDYEVVKEDLKNKVDREVVFQMMQKKVDAELVEGLLDDKVDGPDFEQLITIVEQKADMETLEKMMNLLQSKTDSKDFKTLCASVNRKLDQERFLETESTIDSLRSQVNGMVEEINIQLNETVVVGDNIHSEIKLLQQEMKKKSSKLETDKIKKLVCKKLDSEVFTKEWSNLQKALQQENNQARSEFRNFRTVVEKDMQRMSKDLDKGNADFVVLVEELQERVDKKGSDRENELEELMKYIQGLNENTKGEVDLKFESLADKLREAAAQIRALDETKVDGVDIKKLISGMKQDIKKKVDLEEVQASLNACQADSASKMLSLRDEILNAMRLQNSSVMEELSKKANSSETRKALAQKSESSDIQIIVEGYLRSIELETLADRLGEIEGQVQRTVPGGEVESRMELIRGDMDGLKKALLLKSNLKDVCALLDKKSNVEDVNKAIRALRTSMLNKPEKQDLSQFINEQSLINEFLCTENIIGRWKWKSGTLQNGSLIPWEMQTINTLADNFIWEKNSPFINIIAPGLYKISFGLYSAKKPTGQLLVNGQPVYSALNSSAYVVHHSSGKLAQVQQPFSGKGSKIMGSPHAGLTLIDFLVLPAKARISLTFGCDLPGEGFISVQRIQ